jgi:hypothetical protein
MLERVDLTGTIDIHVHTAPDTVPRSVDDLEAARQAREAGMRGVLLKSHVTCTAGRAAIAQQVVGGIQVWGGLALNRAVGGLNPEAVDTALQLEAKEIWMPTLDAAHGRTLKGQTGGISILDDEGALCAPLYEILTLIREAGAILGTGHLSPRETAALVRTARQQGVSRILITHPASAAVRMPLDAQLALAEEGVFFERCYLAVLSAGREEGIAQVAAQIRRVGVESAVLSTDLGRWGQPAPVEGFRAYLARLGEAGLKVDELRRMAGDNPAFLLGL